MDDLQVTAAMGAALVERGLATTDQVNAELNAIRAERGLPALPTSKTEPAGTATLTSTPETAAEVDPIDALAFAPPDSPARYHFTLPEGALPTAEQLEQEAQLRTAFHEAGIPASIAAEVDRQFVAAMQHPPNAAQQEAARQLGMAQLHRLHGDTQQVQQVLAVARREFDALTAKAPALRDAAEQSGLANSAWLCSTLYNIARSKGRG